MQKGGSCLIFLFKFFKKIFQYTTNFVIYAARSEQYRKAYIQYIKTTLPWLFDDINYPQRNQKPRTRRSDVFIIDPLVRRTSSLPQLALIHDREKTEEKQSEKGVDITTEQQFNEKKIQKSKKKIRFLEVIEEDFNFEVFL